MLDLNNLRLDASKGVSLMQAGFDEIIRSGEQIFSLAKNLDMLGLEKELPLYTQQIEDYFIELDKEKLTPTDIKSLEQVMVTHKNLITTISENKEKISINIKQLQTGKMMQNTYLKTVL